MISPGVFARSIAAATGVLERSIPVVFAKSSKASVINWMLKVEGVKDVTCTVEDMEAMDKSQSTVQRGLNESRGNDGR